MKTTNQDLEVIEWRPINEDDQNQTNESKQLMLEMAQVADFIGYDLIVWPNDPGNIPHFHVLRGSTVNPEFDACIKICSAEYFPHGGKHTDILPRNHLKRMVSVLKSIDPNFGDKTFWQVLIALWNKSRNRHQVPLDTPMPDYLHIV